MNTKPWHNFNSGPALLPEEVQVQAAEALHDVEGSGFSILEIPHRGKLFLNILEEANALVRDLCGLDEQYHILWLQGGGRMAFNLFPMNFLPKGKVAGYMDGGRWGSLAYEAACTYGNAKVISTAKAYQYRRLPSAPSDSSNFSYVHVTSNNTIEGTQWRGLPKFQSPAVVDMSSDFLGVERKYADLPAFYAAAQKNLGAAGVTMYALHKDFLTQADETLNDIFSFKQEAEANSLVNTPPVFSIYTCLLTLRWIKKRGLHNILATNRIKAALLYDEIARNSYFHTPVLPNDRSEMNVVFLAKNERVEQEFLTFAAQHQIANISGHRSVGSFRASLYNALTEKSVRHLCNVMQLFEQTYPSF